MEGRFPYKKLPKYPHLRPCDIKIWEKFIEASPGMYETVDYDLKVGTPRDYKTAPPDRIKEDLEYLSRKRIDVVGYRPSEVHIIELKPSAGIEAIGQVECYFDLYVPFLPYGYSISKVIITDCEIPDIKDLCFKRGILYFVV